MPPSKDDASTKEAPERSSPGGDHAERNSEANNEASKSGAEEVFEAQRNESDVSGQQVAVQRTDATREQVARGNLPNLELYDSGNNSSEGIPKAPSVRGVERQDSTGPVQGQAPSERMLSGFEVAANDQSRTQARSSDGDRSTEATEGAKESSMVKTGMSAEKRTDVNGRDCRSVDKTVADGRHVPVLDVKKAGLPDSEAHGSLSAVPVDINDKPGEQSFLTATHGLVDLPKDNGRSYQLLDDGFKKTDTDDDGNLSRDELKQRVNEANSSAEQTRASASLSYQAQYVLDNYDSIASRSRDLNPNATGVTNEGLAQHYMENAKITLRTADQTKLPAELFSGSRDRDVAILKSKDLTPSEKASIGKNFDVSGTNANPDDMVTAIGHAHGSARAEKVCFIPEQTSGLVSGGLEKGQLIPGAVQRTRLGTIGGMSGGPVVNKDNVVVGINHAGSADSPTSLMIPSAILRDEMEKAKLKK